MPGWLTSLMGKTDGKAGEAGAEGGNPGGSGKLKIVVVEDDRVTLKLIRGILLQQDKYLVTCASDGKEGLELIAKEKPSLVITDIMMPEVDGLSLLRELRKQPETQSLPVILLTVKDSGEDIKEGYRRGADYYMTKPFTKAQLLRGVNLMVGGHEEEPAKVWDLGET